ncbi:MAG: NAD(P)/FAD-dependent oxidoreductase, partial [Lachnospiraceae bacterium]|nr:NAD(P)/FAD-dependent oxidoreductase [Lachnospiraceae bacterium]
MSRNVAVIGAGASGIVAAIAAARCGASVSIFEHTDSIGSKIMITGNGKCNYTNEDIRPEHYHSGTDEDGLIASILERFGYEDCTGFFGSIGIIGKNRRGGIYPYTDTAESVRSALKLELKRLGVEIICGCSNTGLERASGGGIRVKNDLVPDGRVFDAVILSCGGKAA